jgi:hypothetical protein
MHIAGLRTVTVSLLCQRAPLFVRSSCFDSSTLQQELVFSQVHVIVERNLGFEAEHMERALREEPNVIFYRDVQASRTGVLTTENVKLGAMTLTNIMLREARVHLAPDRTLVSQVYHPS